jgi:hypothetical protein
LKGETTGFTERTPSITEKPIATGHLSGGDLVVARCFLSVLFW